MVTSDGLSRHRADLVRLRTGESPSRLEWDHSVWLRIALAFSPLVLMALLFLIGR